MTANTTNYQLPYPERSDQIRFIPEQLKALADKIDTTIDKTGAVFANDYADLPSHVGMSTGQTAFVYSPVQSEKLDAGLWHHYGGKWVRAAVGAPIITLAASDDFAVELWQWQTNGQPYAYARIRAKRDIAITSTNREWVLGSVANEYTPPTYSHFPAYCIQEGAGGDFGIQVSVNGFILETYTLGKTLKQNSYIFTQLTWPCQAIGETLKSTN